MRKTVGTKVLTENIKDGVLVYTSTSNNNQENWVSFVLGVLRFILNIPFWVVFEFIVSL